MYSDLELAATSCVKLWLSLYLSLSLSLSLLSNPDLKLICFLLLSVNCSTFCSASASVLPPIGIMALYKLWIIIIIIFIIIGWLYA